MNVSNFINGLGVGGESVLNTPKQPSENRGAFWSALSAACAEKPGSSEMLFRDKSRARVTLSDEDIETLAANYDPSNMTRAEYQLFLGQLENMGAITAEESDRMQDYFMADAEEDLRGDLTAKLQHMPGVSVQEMTGLNTLTDIVSRIDGVINGMSLLEQATGGNLWVHLRQHIIENAQEKEEQRQEDEKLELLNLILDNMTGRNDPQVSAATGLRLGMNADQDAVNSGYLPSELHAYLLTLASKSTDEMVEETEDERARIEAVDETGTEKLHAGEERRQHLSEDDLMNLAKKYDPNNMSREQYNRFLEDMVKYGVASQETIERIGYHGLMAAYDGETPVRYVSQEPNAPVFQQSPVDGDIEGWIKNRMLWKPGITREAARREGLSNQYENMLEEEKTLSRIAEVLADVKRQRYPSIAL